MTRQGALLFVLLTAGCSSAPTAPQASTFQLSAGPYRLSFGGTECFVLTGGLPSTPVSTMVQLDILLAPSAGGFRVTSPGHAVGGEVASNGTTMTGTIAGTALVGPLLFRTGLLDDDPIVFGGVARDGDRFEGQITAGRPSFSVKDAGGSSTAICTGATFTLRRA